MDAIKTVNAEHGDIPIIPYMTTGATDEERSELEASQLMAQ